MLAKLIINNLTVSTKTYLGGLVSISENSSLTITDDSQKQRLAVDGQLKSDIFSTYIQISDGINTYAGVDAVSYLESAFLVKQYIERTDSYQNDSYGRLRVTSPNLIFGIHFTNTLHPLLMNNALAGASTLTFNSTIGSARLTNTTSSSDSAIFQTKKYLIYNAGSSYQLLVTGVMGSPTTNLTQRWGYFDANNGIFFEQTSAGLVLKTRTSTSGSVVDTSVAQSSWNLDKLDGTGSSGLNLDPSKHNVYIMDFVWQGAGRVRIGVLSHGKIVYCHQFFNDNINTAPYWRTPSLPGRVELNNTGTTNSSNTMDIICIAALKEGVDEVESPYTFTASNNNQAINVSNVTLPLVSIKPSLTFNGLTNRVQLLPLSFGALPSGQNILFKLILNGTLTGASFTSVDTNSAALYDTSATAISGGTVLFQFYVSNNLSQYVDLSFLTTQALLSLNIDGSSADILTLAALSTAGGVHTFGSLTWGEFQ